MLLECMQLASGRESFLRNATDGKREEFLLLTCDVIDIVDNIMVFVWSKPHSRLTK